MSVPEVWLSDHARLRALERGLDERSVVEEVAAAILEGRVSCRRPAEARGPVCRIHPGGGRLRFAITSDRSRVFLLRRIKGGARRNGWLVITAYPPDATPAWLTGAV